MKKVILISLFLCLARMGYGQLANLHIGDTVPPTKLTGFYNDSAKELNTDSLRGKMVIFSFWSTYCSSCISAMPKLQSLQQQFKDSLVVVLVTQQPRSIVDAFWKYNHITKKITLPNLVGDIVLAKHFAHLGVPYEVWIDVNGVVKGLTTAQYVNEKNIRAVLRNEKVDWPVSQIKPKLKDGYLFNIAPRQQSLGSASYYTVLSPSITGLKLNHGFSFLTDTIKGVNHFRAINFAILDFYRFAMAEEPIFNSSRNRFVLNVGDSSRYFYQKDKVYREQWIRQNAFCYESTYPIALNKTEFRTSIRAELDRVFKLKSAVVEKEMFCWVITKSGHARDIGKAKNGTVYKSIGELLLALNYRIENPPVLDETNQKNSISIVLKGNTTDFNQLNKDLAGYGFQLEKAWRNIKVLTIDEIK